MIVVRDGGTPEGGVAGTHGDSATSSAELESTDVAGSGKSPVGVPGSVGVTCTEEGAVAGLDLLGEFGLSGIRVRDSAEL